MANASMDLLEKIKGMGTTVSVVAHGAEVAARAGRQSYLLDGRLIDMESRETPAPLFKPDAVPTQPPTQV